MGPTLLIAAGVVAVVVLGFVLGAAVALACGGSPDDAMAGGLVGALGAVEAVVIVALAWRQLHAVLSDD